MLKPALISLVLALALQGAQAQMQFHGPPASITSPGPDGSLHGTPASILSPTPVQGPNGRAFFGGRRSVHFGNPRQRHEGRDHRGVVAVPVPLFIPAYDTTDYSVSQADPPVADQPSYADNQTLSESDALREAYYRGAHDALKATNQDDRYGDHYLDSREKRNPRAADSSKAPAAKNNADTAEPAPNENTQPTVFVFKDGHKLQTQNFAIVGQTLFDFSTQPLTKIKLAELDLDATRKVNDDLGNSLRLQ